MARHEDVGSSPWLLAVRFFLPPGLPVNLTGNSPDLHEKGMPKYFI